MEASTFLTERITAYEQSETIFAEWRASVHAFCQAVSALAVTVDISPVTLEQVQTLRDTISLHYAAAVRAYNVTQGDYAFGYGESAVLIAALNHADWLFSAFKYPARSMLRSMFAGRAAA